MKQGRKKCTSFCIVDSQSVKNADTAETKGYDAGKKISGIKRHIVVDTQGLLHAIHITPANITDRAGALEAFWLNVAGLKSVKNVLADGEYTGESFAAEVKNILGASVKIAKRNKFHTFAVTPQRWVVERSFAWLDKCRRPGKTVNVSLVPAYK